MLTISDEIMCEVALFVWGYIIQIYIRVSEIDVHRPMLCVPFFKNHSSGILDFYSNDLASLVNPLIFWMAF